MKTCKTCKHWQRDDEIYDQMADPFDENTYEREQMPFNVKWCKSPDLLFFQRPENSHEASVVDHGGCEGNLLTAEDFGCTNHQIDD